MSFEVIINSQIQVFADAASFPATGLLKTIYIAKDNSSAYYWNDTTTSYELLGGAPASTVWGAISGNIADQTDLINLLDDKVPYTGATGNVDLGEYQIKAGQVELDQTPTGTFGVGKMRWNDTDGTAEIRLKGNNVTLQIGQEQVKRVVNKTSPLITLQESAYQAVIVAGAQGQRLSVKLAKGDSDANSAGTIGIVTETIAANQEGFITTSGEVRGINTTGSLQGETWADGDILYLSPTTFGALTNIKPIAPNHLVVIGYVEYAHGVNGKIFVKVDNGYELEELHNVTATNYTTPQDEDSFLFFDETQTLWKRLRLDNLKSNLITLFNTLYQSILVSGTNIKTIEGQSLLGSGNIDLTKSDVGLSNVDDTSDLDKPISTATQTALNAKQNTLVSGTNIKTINGSSVLGSGDLVISGGGGGLQGIHAMLPLSSGDSITNSINGTNLNGSIIANRITASPFIPAQDITSSSLYVNCSGAVAGALGRILIYSDLNGKPYSKLYESADLDLSTTGLKTAITTFNFIAGEIYWLCYHSNSLTPVMSQLSNTNGVLLKTSAGIGYNMMFQNIPLGTAPSTWTATLYNSFNIPLIGITKA